MLDLSMVSGFGRRMHYMGLIPRGLPQKEKRLTWNVRLVLFTLYFKVL